MPINKTVGNLWFKTQDEIDAYDDRNLAHMRLKNSDNFEDPNYSLLASRDRKERFFEESQLSKDTRA